MSPLVTGVAKLLTRNFSETRRRFVPAGGASSTPITASVVVAAGGGGGASAPSAAPPTGYSGGGGAGGLINQDYEFLVGTTYTITIGGGSAAGGTGNVSRIRDGGPTAPIVLTCNGGGSGGPAPGGNGGPGGSGGGGGNVSGSGGSGTSGQGNSGTPGGGAGGSKNPTGGFDATNYSPGSLTLSAGGGGGNVYGTVGAQGSPGAANTGNGGGGSRKNNSNPGINRSATTGGSGCIIIRYASPTALATGGTITSIDIDGTTYQLHNFTGSGTFAIN